MNWITEILTQIPALLASLFRPDREPGSIDWRGFLKAVTAALGASGVFAAVIALLTHIQVSIPSWAHGWQEALAAFLVTTAISLLHHFFGGAPQKHFDRNRFHF